MLGLVTWGDDRTKEISVFTGLPELFDRGFNRDTLLLAIMQKIFLRLPHRHSAPACTNFDRCHRPKKQARILEELKGKSRWKTLCLRQKFILKTEKLTSYRRQSMLRFWFYLKSKKLTFKSLWITTEMRTVISK
ncbi:unnamed protein product, partial [Mesorhabditis belari]|uniref:Uncharacterized protein n=1 Tax=Mesorhabditis belari TaxID=2138241 RepID=A0AAF3FFD9_9BILA